MEYKGLSEKEAAKKLEEHGRNELQEFKKESLPEKFIRQFKDALILLLIGAAIISFFLGEEIDAAMIMFIVVMLAVLGFVQEYKAEKSFEALKKLTAPKTRVMRDGTVKLIDVAEVVPGDIVLLEAGDRVPADGKVVKSFSLSLDEASITGESVPVSKDTENKNKVFMGTVVTLGRGTVKVEGTGMNTEIGKIAKMVQTVKKEKTPLEEHLEKLGKTLSLGVIVLCIIIFAIGVLSGIEPFVMFTTAVSLAVAAIPEGLPAVVTVALAIGVQRMAKRKAIVRKLKSVETLGSADIICTDKTGTLTRNEMTVRKIFVNNEIVDVGGTGYEPKGDFKANGKKAEIKGELKLLLRTGLLCNNARLKQISENNWDIIGDSTEGALVVAARKAGISRNDLHAEWPEMGEIPFDSDRKRMSTINGRKKQIAHIKGAPESMLEISSKIIENGKVRKMTEEDVERITEKNNSLTSKGYRVLALGYKEYDKKKVNINEVENSITFIGLVGMIDAPREEVKSALELCRTAGIRVMMITGDHPLTAKAIAQELGIDGSDAVTGDQLDKMSDKEFEETVEKVPVFARVSPAHKLRIVTMLNKKGNVVAMTGDGVNDSPALKKADIGVAMGITGTDVAKESSDLILTDDNFATIVAAIEEGRGIYENIRKTLAFLISGNIVEVAVIFFAIILGMPLPLIAIQILWINLVTDGLPAIALSADPIDKSVMDKPPRKKRESIWKGMEPFIVEYPVIITAVTLITFAYTYSENLILAQTVAFTMIVMFEKVQAFACRSLEKPVWKHVLENKWLVYATLLTIVLHLAILYIPVLNDLFYVVPLSIENWIFILVTSIFAFLYLEIRKYINLKLNKKSKRA